MKELSTLLAVLGMVLALAPAANAAIVPITSVSATTNTVPDPDTLILDSFTVGAVTYTTATDLVTGTSATTDGGTGVITDQDNFDSNLHFSRGPGYSDWTTSFVLDGANWSDSNGADADFFIFEAGGNDTLNVAPIFADNSVGDFVMITTNSAGVGYNWGNTGVILTEGERDGQTIHGVAFAITDLKDAGGAALSNSTVIKGLAFDAPNTDIASISAVPAPDTAPTITSTNPDDGDTNVSIFVDLVATFDEHIALTGSGTVTIRDLGPGADVVINLPDDQVSVSGSDLTINPTNNLLPGNSYAVQISADAVEDLTTNAFAGILNDTTWNFDTAAAVAGVTLVDIGVDGNSSVRGTSDWNTSLTLDADGNAYAVFIDENMKNTVVKVTPGGVVTTQIIDTTDNEDDAHNTPSIAIDGDGFIHVAYNMHNHNMRLRKSPAANTVSGTWVDEGGTGSPWDLGRFTYPAMSTAPNGDVYMTIRNREDGVWTGAPDQLFHYDNTINSWSSIAKFADEDGWTAYLPAPFVDENGKVHLVWHWRLGGAGVPRHRGSYAVYDPGDDKFYEADGTEYTIPITHTTSDLYQPMEAADELDPGISDHSVTVNALGQPIIAYNFFRGGSNDQRVVRLARWDGSAWQHTDLAGPETGTTLGDPALVNRDGTLHIYYKDADGKPTLRSSTDNGLTFGDAITLTGNAVSAAHVHIGTSIGSNKEAIFCMDPSDNYAAQVMFVDYAQVGGPEIDVTGNGVSIPDGDITPILDDHTDFDSTITNGLAIVRTYTVTNSGSANLTLTEPTLSGDTEFVASALSSTNLTPGGAAATFTVTYTPSATPAVHTNTVSLVDNDPMRVHMLSPSEPKPRHLSFNWTVAPRATWTRTNPSERSWAR